MSLTHEPDCSSSRQIDDKPVQLCSPPLVSVSIKDPLVLQHCYLPFLKRGGLFVPSERRYPLRQRLFLLLKLPAAADAPGTMVAHGVTATVAWITPQQAQADQRMGFGLHFDAGEPNLKQFIESLLKALV